jgi:hypothetical protein
MTRLSRCTMLLLAALASACTMGVKTRAAPDFKGEPLAPNEKHAIVSPCEEHQLSPGRVLLEVAVDQQGKPLEARVTAIGGTVRHAFANCVHTRMMAASYAPRGKPVTLGAMVDLRVGQFANAGSPTPAPPGY